MEEKLKSIIEFYNQKIEELKELRSKSKTLEDWCNNYIDKEYFERWLIAVDLKEQDFFNWLKSIYTKTEEVLKKVVIKLNKNLSIEQRLTVYYNFKDFLDALPEEFYIKTFTLLDDIEKELNKHGK